MSNQTQATPGIWQQTSIGFEEALLRMPQALKKEGFGVITEIDMRETLKAKLGVDFPRYKIFGACNPALAHAALQKDPRIGVLLPCNVALYEQPDGTVLAGAVDPMQTIGAATDSELQDVARDVTLRLKRVIAELCA